MGLSLLGATIYGGIYKVHQSSQAMVDTYHFRHMLHQYAGHVLEENALSQQQTEAFQQLSSNCTQFLQMRAYGCSSYMQVLLALYDLIVKAGMPQVSGQAGSAQRQAALGNGDSSLCGCRCLKATRRGVSKTTSF